MEDWDAILDELAGQGDEAEGYDQLCPEDETPLVWIGPSWECPECGAFYASDPDDDDADEEGEGEDVNVMTVNEDQDSAQ